MHVSPLLHDSVRHPDADIVLTEGELDPATPGERLLVAPWHIHRSDEEIFYVLSGRIGFNVGDDEFIAVAGDAVLVPPGAIHNWWNADPEPARYLIAMSKKMDDLINKIHEHYRDEDEMKALFEEHDTTYIGWSR